MPGSGLRSPSGWPPSSTGQCRRCRSTARPAPVSYRIIPRVLGQVHRAVAAAEKAATVSLRSVTSDVVYVGDEAGHLAGRAVRSGGYLNGMAYPALNALSAAWADLALVAERQV